MLYYSIIYYTILESGRRRPQGPPCRGRPRGPPFQVKTGASLQVKTSHGAKSRRTCCCEEGGEGTAD